MAYTNRTRRVAVTPDTLKVVNLIVAALYPGENGKQGEVIELIVGKAWRDVQQLQAKHKTAEQIRETFTPQ